ncbi:sulfur carrier protein ThiS [Scandinavium sp. V105_16]|uniref:Sulfur carrier protein ThiS n=1 Tax=Scandinavium lactucae TaxID=3095028 RepID=A0AAJ2S5C9_9ENTR|nr:MULTISPECIES: sulfur carrier protein ThiS [unclassified Scandinavium]MDX6019698.1 sulfur carrier protein ThiS [Scandinavium sp. V105_16]MDX6032777.1 sulfur carrier protein ThiS [Scandinavium sp. V105_12]MDX6040086.1 sulfur carrier protein ThiS [Scandinavium sp. V105_6]MDX6048646.1 sulfur carrier protein ThiS [Scandinavium sp. V105_1]
MNVLVNELRVECETGLTVAALLSRLEQDKPGVALALNQQILPRTQWADHSLQEGDALLLFQVIAGG